MYTGGTNCQAHTRWMIDPRRAKASSYKSLSDVTELQAGDELDGGEVLPGFKCRLGDIL